MAAMRLIKIPSIENTNPREMRRGAGEDYANFLCVKPDARTHREATSSAAAAVMLELLARSSSSSRLEHTPFRDMQHPKSRGCLYGVKKNYYA